MKTKLLGFMCLFLIGCANPLEYVSHKELMKVSESACDERGGMESYKATRRSGSPHRHRLAVKCADGKTVRFTIEKEWK